jgi:hypothetical protein
VNSSHHRRISVGVIVFSWNAVPGPVVNGSSGDQPYFFAPLQQTKLSLVHHFLSSLFFVYPGYETLLLLHRQALDLGRVALFSSCDCIWALWRKEKQTFASTPLLFDEIQQEMIGLVLMNRHRHPQQASQNPTWKPFLFLLFKHSTSFPQPASSCPVTSKRRPRLHRGHRGHWKGITRCSGVFLLP